MIDCAATNNVTLATVCASCHAAFLFELTNDWDVAFETTVASRPQEPEAAALLGNFFYLPLMRVSLAKVPQTTLVTLLKNVQSQTTSALLHARAQWSPVGNNTLERSADGVSINYPITSFQFEQYQKSFTLDVSSEDGPVLEYVHNEKDYLLAGMWARAAGRSSFFTEAFYMLPDMRLTFGTFFSSASYNYSTAVSSIFFSELENLFTCRLFRFMVSYCREYFLFIFISIYNTKDVDLSNAKISYRTSLARKNILLISVIVNSQIVLT